MLEVKLNDEIVYTLSDLEENILKHSINSDNLVEDIKRRLKFIIENKVDRTYSRMKEEWIPILEKDEFVIQVPIKRAPFVNMIRLRQDYKDKKQKESEERQVTASKQKNG